MHRCDKLDCGKKATLALKLLFYIAPDKAPAMAFINLTVCDEHTMANGEVIEFLKQNWNALCIAFAQIKEPLPIYHLTTWDWCPIAEAEEFWREGEVSAAQRNALNN